MTDHIKIKHKIQAIADVRDFESLLRVSMLSDEDKELLRLYYINGKNFAFVADTLLREFEQDNHIVRWSYDSCL